MLQIKKIILLLLCLQFNLSITSKNIAPKDDVLYPHRLSCKPSLMGATLYGQIYLITNLHNGKIYIGQTIYKVNDRWSDHCSSAIRCINKHKTMFHAAIRKYGKPGFTCQSICFCFSREALDEAEIDLIKAYRATDRSVGYNIAEGGKGASGTKWSDEAREGARQRMLGKKQSEELIKLRSKSLLGRAVTPETRDKISKKLKGNKNGTNNKSWLGKKLPFCLKVKRGLFNKGSKHFSSKKVVQLDSDKNLIKVFDSLTIASKELKITNISRACQRGFERKPGGFHFMYLTTYNKWQQGLPTN